MAPEVKKAGHRMTPEVKKAGYRKEPVRRNLALKERRKKRKRTSNALIYRKKALRVPK
jgi:hypothetical protein